MSEPTMKANSWGSSPRLQITSPTLVGLTAAKRERHRITTGYISCWSAGSGSILDESPCKKIRAFYLVPWIWPL